MAAFQGIAAANGGNRAAGLPGYEKSVEYVVATLEAAGWNVSIDEFPFSYVGPAELQQLTPVNATYATGAYTGTGYGQVQGNVIPVDINLTGDRASTSGCEAADFAGLNFGGTSDIALIQRGTCPFGQKAVNAQAAGAEAVIMFNQGDSVGAGDRLGLIVGTLLPSSVPVTIPVVGASFAQGVALAAAGSTARVFVPAPESRPQKNVIAELPGRTSDNVVMAGAHLDSVPAGPGINDNGSGSAALLELAQNLSKVKPDNTIRLAWWGAEERGLIGSTEYVAGLSMEEKARIGLYLNFDMIASPNYIFMVYDGDQSGFPAPAGVPIPPGSIEIEDLFESYFTSVGAPYDDAQFSGRSDYQAFINAGIPSGGLFTGAEVLKTPAQALIWGGTAGQAYDPCYHAACDNDRQRQHARARRELRRDRARRPRVRVLDRVGQRRRRRTGARWAEPARTGGARGHGRKRGRPRPRPRPRPHSRLIHDTGPSLRRRARIHLFLVSVRSRIRGDTCDARTVVGRSPRPDPLAPEGATSGREQEQSCSRERLAVEVKPPAPRGATPPEGH